MNPRHSDSGTSPNSSSQSDERASGGLVLQPISDMSEYEHKPLEEAQQAAQIPQEQIEKPHSNLGVMPVRVDHSEPVIRRSPALYLYKIVMNCLVLAFFVYLGFLIASLGLASIQNMPNVVIDGGPLLWIELLAGVVVLSIILKAQRKIYTSLYVMEVRKILRRRLATRLFIVPILIGYATYSYSFTNQPLVWAIIPLVLVAILVITAPFVYYAWRHVAHLDEEEKRAGETYHA